MQGGDEKRLQRSSLQCSVDARDGSPRGRAVPDPTCCNFFVQLKLGLSLRIAGFVLCWINWSLSVSTTT
jgi:hypothetical protein